MAYRDFKDLPRRTVSDKVLLDKAFEISSNSYYSGYQDGITSTINNSLIRGLETPLLTHRLELFLMINI